MTIADDDAPPAVRVSNAWITEGDGGTRNVHFTIRITFHPGQRTKTVAVEVPGDNWREPTESFALVITGITNGTIDDGSGTATIFDDDADSPPEPASRAASS